MGGGGQTGTLHGDYKDIEQFVVRKKGACFFKNIQVMKYRKAKYTNTGANTTIRYPLRENFITEYSAG
jgi:hypothetical protein